MASPKTDLPFVVAGMIWDGDTEYSDLRPPDLAGPYLLRMYGDGTRRFSESYSSSNPMQHLRLLQGRGWNPIGVTFTRPDYPTEYRGTNGFLHYDGSLSFESANQFFQIKNFREHAARFAHQLQISMGHHTISSMSEANQLTIHQTLSRMIGTAARRYQKWYEIDPIELIDGGTLDEQPLWKSQQADYEETHNKLCGRCEGDFFPVSMALNANLPAFERVNGHGEIYAPDRSTARWQPELMELATDPYDEFYDEIKVHFDLMVNHYLDDIGKQDRLSSHA